MQTEKNFPLFPKRSLPRFLAISLQRYFVLILLLLSLMLFGDMPVEAADSCRNGSPAVCLENRSVDDVIDAFENLTHHGEWLGFRPGADSPIRFIGSEKAHMQGIARSQRAGTPYLFISSAGNKYDEGDVGFDYSDANLMVIEMGSRDPTGERLRSNRLLRGEETECTVPPSADKVVTNITFPDYNHPGTLAIVGDILAVPFEQPAKPFSDEYYDCDPIGTTNDCNGHLPEGKISFYNVSDPQVPELIFDLVPVANVSDPGTPTRLAEKPVPGEVLMTQKGFGIIGLTRLPDDYFLLVTGAGVGSKLEFWRSNKTSFFNDGAEQRESFAFKRHSNVYKQHVDANGIPIPDSPEMEDWFVAGGGAFHTYQNYSFVNQTDGSLFMIVGRNVFAGAPIEPGEDRIALYEVTGFEEGGQILFTNIKTEAQGIVNFSNDVSDLISPCTGSNPGGINNPIKSSNANLIAGSNTYISPTGELLFYAVEHYNWGPTADEATDKRTVRMAELRHQKVVREDSPTYLPSADAGIDYYVDEGSTITLNGAGSRSASAVPWAQLFEYKKFAGQSVMFDYADRDKDDYDNFAKLDGKNPIDELCFDAEKLDEVRVPIMKVMENWSQFGSMDLMVDTCIGSMVINGKCYVTPPITDPIANEVCHIPCKLIFDSSDRHDCHMICDNGTKGPVVSFPDISGAAWNFIVATFNPAQPSELCTAVTEIIDLAASVRNCGDLEYYIPSTPPPLPDINLFTNISSKIDPSKNIVEEYFKLLASFPDFVSSIKTQFEVLTNYPYQLITYIDDFAESMKGFNNRASSVRWYAPSGQNISLYQKADHGGGYLTLHGTGSVEEIANLSYGQLSGGGNANNSVRSVQFDAEFSSPSIESYSWSIESPFPVDPYMLHYALTPTPTFDATGGDGPLTAEIWLEVFDNDGKSAQAQVKVNIVNVPPVVEIDGIRDEIGGTTYTQIPEFPVVGMPILIEALEYGLFGSFTDVGVLDTQISSIEWGDGRSNSSDDNSFLLTNALNRETGTVNVPHVYVSKGIYPIVLTVEDDDGGTGQTTLTVQVVDAAGALELQIEALASIIYDAGNSDKHLLKALEKLQGNNEGAAQNGSLDKFQNAKPKPALEKIYQAKKEIEIAEKLDPNLDLTAIKDGLTLIVMSSNAAELLASEAE